MCLALPAKIISCLPNNEAIISLAGVKKKISTALLEQQVEPGDYVIIHVGFALTILDPVEAEKTLALAMVEL